MLRSPRLIAARRASQPSARPSSGVRSDFWQQTDDGSEGVSIFLDGVHQPLAIKAHAGQGWIVRWKTDSAGQLVKHTLHSGNVEEIVNGNVEIRRCDPEAW